MDFRVSHVSSSQAIKFSVPLGADVKELQFLVYLNKNLQNDHEYKNRIRLSPEVFANHTIEGEEVKVPIRTIGDYVKGIGDWKGLVSLKSIKDGVANIVVKSRDKGVTAYVIGILARSAHTPTTKIIQTYVEN